MTDASHSLVPPAPALKPKSYSDNFRFGRTENWSH